MKLFALILAMVVLTACKEKQVDSYLQTETPSRSHSLVGRVTATAWVGEEEGGIQKMSDDARKMGADAVINVTRKRGWSSLANQEVVEMEGDAVKWR